MKNEGAMKNDRRTGVRRRIALLLSLVPLAGCSLAGAEAAEIRSITACTRVTKWGQMPVCFQIRGQQLPEGIQPEDFELTGEAGGWGTSAAHPFSCEIREVVPAEDGWDLIPEQFPDKYFYVRSFSVQCSKAPELSFTMEEIGETLTETADSFHLLESENHRIKAQIYRPEATEPLPVVVVFHGYGDTANLLTYRTAVDWAEPEHQAVRPCIVIAPVINDNSYFLDRERSRVFDQVLEWIDEMIEAGTADPDRIYLMGNSFGGMAAIEMAQQHPDRIAAVLALCPALNYSPTARRAWDQMVGIPLYLVQAEKDETIPSSVSREAAEAFTEAGGEVILKIYSDKEMEAAGAVHGSEQTYSFHHAELALLENDEYAQWLFSHTRKAE